MLIALRRAIRSCTPGDCLVDVRNTSPSLVLRIKEGPSTESYGVNVAPSKVKLLVLLVLSCRACLALRDLAIERRLDGDPARDEGALPVQDGAKGSVTSDDLWLETGGICSDSKSDIARSSSSRARSRCCFASSLWLSGVDGTENVACFAMLLGDSVDESYRAMGDSVEALDKSSVLRTGHVILELGGCANSLNPGKLQGLWGLVTDEVEVTNQESIS
mmetsp:Transcript_145028/g.263449  ORF Transcript_145028/g.263449 Transcript_145028/m.263449 type:complete len:218 (-) Transcript_145028:29-682(-)